MKSGCGLPTHPIEKRFQSREGREGNVNIRGRANWFLDFSSLNGRENTDGDVLLDMELAASITILRGGWDAVRVMVRVKIEMRFS